MGTIEQKFNYTFEAKEEIKQATNALGGDLTDDSELKDYAEALRGVYNDMPKVTGEGTEVTLTPTRKGRLALIPKGNSTQKSTEGNQLVNYDGTEVTLKQSGTRAIYVTPTNFPLTLQAGTYTFNYEDLLTTNTTNGLFTTLITTTGNIDIPKTSSGKTSTFTLTEEKTINRMYFYVAAVDTGATAKFSKIMLNSGSEALPWEEYTNGPAPNPSYPFPIKNVTGNNNVVVNSKNFYDGEERYNNNDSAYNSSFVPNNTSEWYGRQSISKISSPLTISTNIYLDTAQYLNTRFAIYFYDKNNIAISGATINGTNATASNKKSSVTISKNLIPDSAKTFEIRIRFEGKGHTENTQIELGSTATDYVPYQNQTKPLNLGNIELNGIGTYQDYIFKTTGKNLWKPYNFTRLNNNRINWETKTDGTISASGTATGTAYSALTADLGEFKFLLPAGTYTLSGGTSKILLNLINVTSNTTITTTNAGTGKATTILAEDTYCQVRANIQNGTALTGTETVKPMLEKGDTATTYEPFGSGKWYKHEEIGKYIFTGATSEAWDIMTATHNNFTRFRIRGLEIMPTNRLALSNYFIIEETGNETEKNVLDYRSTGTLLVNTDVASTVETFKTWLSTHNLIVYHVSATATDIELTDTTLISQLEDIDKMQSYSGTTIITSTYEEGNAQMIINGSALKEWEEN